LMLMQQTTAGKQIHTDMQWLDRNTQGNRPVNAIAHCFCAF